MSGSACNSNLGHVSQVSTYPNAVQEPKLHHLLSCDDMRQVVEKLSPRGKIAGGLLVINLTEHVVTISRMFYCV